MIKKILNNHEFYQFNRKKHHGSFNKKQDIFRISMESLTLIYNKIYSIKLKMNYINVNIKLTSYIFLLINFCYLINPINNKGHF
jgi:hypothetical protein